MGRESLMPIAGIVVFVLLLLVAAVYLYFDSKPRQADASETSELPDSPEDQLRARNEEGVRLGVFGKDSITGEYYVKCAICDEVATSFAPKTYPSWIDRLPLLTRLHGLPPRYVIRDHIHGGKKYCESHKEMSVKVLEELHANLRHARSKFNSEQANKVAALNLGALEKAVTTKDKATRLEVNLLLGHVTDTPLPALGPIADELDLTGLPDDAA